MMIRIVFIIGIYTLITLQASVLQDKLNSQEHFIDKNNDPMLEHNDEYDHEAFLGKKEADKFKELTEEESLKQLGIIFDKIDVNNDSFVVEEELYNWIRDVSKITVNDEVDKRWKLYDPDNKGYITIETILKINYDALNHWPEEDKIQRKDHYERYLTLIERDKKRFSIADADLNEKLNKTEYADFIFPDKSPRMREIVINETFADMDRNNDSFIDIEEFVIDIYPKHKDGRPEPEWVKNERDNFKTYHDTNKDGKLDVNELAAWILPEGYDEMLSETKHLIYEADINHDSKLTKDEVLKKSHIFVSVSHKLYKREDL